LNNSELAAHLALCDMYKQDLIDREMLEVMRATSADIITNKETPEGNVAEAIVTFCRTDMNGVQHITMLLHAAKSEGQISLLRTDHAGWRPIRAYLVNYRLRRQYSYDPNNKLWTVVWASGEEPEQRRATA
jgi:hypothetical protein